LDILFVDSCAAYERESELLGLHFI